MAFVTPPTFVSGATLTAANLNILGADISDLDARVTGQAGSGVAVRKNTNTAISTSTWTDISWATSPVDTTGWWTSGTDLVVPSSAIPAGSTTIAIECEGSARFAANGTGSRGIQFLQNGTAVESSYFTSALTGDTTGVSIVVWAVCAAADVIKMQLWQSSGGSLNAAYMSAHVKRLWVVS